MNALFQDVRYGLRMLVKNYGFTILAVLTLALGIGANTAIFSLLDQVLLRRLPVREPEQLVQLESSGADTGRTDSYGGNPYDYFSYPMYRDLRDQNTVFAGVLATDSTQVGVEWHNQADLAATELVSGNYFEVLGVRAALGRLLAGSDDLVQNANPVVVLSFAYWQRKFGAEPGILDQAILVNGHPFTVIGVARPTFHSIVVGNTPDLFAPMMMKPEITPDWNDLDNRRSRWLNIFARLKPGEKRSQAEAGINLLWHSLRADELREIKNKSASFRERFLDKSRLKLLDGSLGFSPLRESIRTPLLIVMGMVGLVILMACANVAGLLLVRAAGRVREISVRYALGAERRRIAQQLLVEGLLLGTLGGSLGLLLAPSVSGLLARRLSSDPQTAMAFSTYPDLRVLAFNFGLAFAASLLFSLMPMLEFWHPDLTPALKQQTISVASGKRHLRRAVVGVQIGLSLLLLVGSGLFLRTLYNLKTFDVGFVTDHLVTFGLDPKLAGYDAQETPILFRRLEDSLAALPEVHSVAATTDPELADDSTRKTITIPGYTPREEEDMNVEWSTITPTYLSTLETQFLAGRNFSEPDGPDATKVAVVNESLARHFFATPQMALGHFLNDGEGEGKANLQIIGVVKDTRHKRIRSDVEPTVFVPYRQAKDAGNSPLQFYVRTWQTPQAAESAIRNTIEKLDSKLVVDGMRTMDEQIDEILSTERLIALLAASFGVLATSLAAIGLYGILAFTTVQRTREIGIRLALGASRGTIARMVLTEVAQLAGTSILVALPLAWILSQLVHSQLFGVSNHDPLTLGATTLLVAMVALLAAWLPTRRATRIDPMVALRYE
ncbi:MAG TPA: ABC transporter permease [Terriglobales bacterium]|nr:ABC transporter permease [Terriglobales bacterium]